MRTSKFDLVKLDGILKRDFFVALATGRGGLPGTKMLTSSLSL